MKNLKLIGIVGKMLWITGLLMFFIGMLIRNETVQKLIANNTGNLDFNFWGLSISVAGAILLLPGIALLIVNYRNTEKITETNIKEVELSQEELLHREMIVSRAVLINNLPFLFVKLFFGMLTLLGIISVIIENLNNYKYVIFGTLMLIPVGLITFYFFKKIKAHFEELKQIKNSVKDE